MVLKFIDIYNRVAEQAWSMYDAEVESKDEFEAGLSSSIQKALSDLWCSYPFPFRVKPHSFVTEIDIAQYDMPCGDIYEMSDNCSNQYDIMVQGGNYLEYLSPLNLQNKNKDDKGLPKYFSILNNKIILFPTPDDTYTVDCNYLSLYVGKNKDGDDIFNLVQEDEYIDIDIKYEDLFLNTLITKSMCYAIASQTDENYSGYQSQYLSAYKNLINCVNGLKIEKRIMWWLLPMRN